MKRGQNNGKSIFGLRIRLGVIGCLILISVSGYGSSMRVMPESELSQKHHELQAYAQRITPDQARAYYKHTGPVGFRPHRDRDETEVTPEILELARALQYDPLLILDYVHNYIDYVPFFGSVNGATATLLAKRGNDWDQVSLLIALLRESGFTAEYVVGDVWYPLSRLADWTGVNATVNPVAGIFARGGIPAGIFSPPGNSVVTRVWAQVEILGETYVFDPAMKNYDAVPGIDLNTAIGYDHTAFLANAMDGAGSGDDFVQNVNESNIRTDLTTYSSNLVDYIRTNIPDTSLVEIISGREIEPMESTVYPTALPFAVQVENAVTYHEIPQMYRHTIRIQHEGIDETYNTYEIAGKRFTMFYGDINFEPMLYLDGNLQATGNPTTPPNRYPITVTIDHPYAANGGTYCDETNTFYLAGGSAYALITNFETVSQDLIDKHSRELSRQLYLGGAAESEPVLGETLMGIGLNWFQEVRQFKRILGSVTGTINVEHHNAGILGQEDGYFISIPMGCDSVSSISDDSNNVKAAYRTSMAMSSAFEHGVLEQKQGSDKPAVSSIRLLQINNNLGGKTYLANAGNWDDIQLELINYYPEIIALITSYIQAGYEVIVPQNGEMILNEWAGVGFITHYENASNVAMNTLIGGYYFGGWVTFREEVNSEQMAWIQEQLDRMNQPQEPVLSQDPVDMGSGAFLFDSTDLSIRGQGTMGLQFKRMYNSGSGYSPGPMGYGWSHNYDMSASVLSDETIGLGRRLPVEAASAIVTAFITYDLLTTQVELPEWVTSVITAKWGMDSLIDNAVAVSLGETNAMFYKLPDGTYSAPPATGLRLGDSGSGFYVTDPFGTRFDFSSEGKVVSLTDSNNNIKTFAYNGEGYLETVTDCFGDTLTFSYDTGRIINIEDFTGRDISYTYTGGLLTAYIDPDNKSWTYGYDGEGLMSTVVHPLSNVIVTNTYDSLGRVMYQHDAYGELINSLYFSGFRNVLEDDRGYQTVHFYDKHGQMIRQRDADGNSTLFQFNGLQQMTLIQDRLGGLTSFTYHTGSGETASRTNAEGETVIYTYEVRGGGPDIPLDPDTFYNHVQTVYPDTTREIFTHDGLGNVLTSTDRAGKTSTFTYNTRGQVLTATNAKTGLTTYAYNADGFLETASDAESGTITYGYDTAGNNILITYDNGTSTRKAYTTGDRLDYTIDERNNQTDYQYDDNGNLTKIIDPTGMETIRTYDLNDRLQTQTDRRLGITSYAYDPQGRMISETDPNNITIEYGYSPIGKQVRRTVAGHDWMTSYDAEGVESSFTTPMNFTTTYLTNQVGYNTDIIDPLTHQTTLLRDAMQRNTEYTDPLNRTSVFTYNGWDSLDSTTVPDIGTATYTRDDLGNVTEVNDLTNHVWTCQYSNFGKMIVQEDPVGNTWQHTYDTRGRRYTTTYEDSDVLTRGYDDAGNLISKQFLSGLSLTYGFHPQLNRMLNTENLELTYDAEGNILVTTTINTQTTDFTAAFDNGGRLETLEYCNGLFTVTYVYQSQTGLLSQVSDSLSGVIMNFAYDNDRRMTEISRTNGVTTTYTWDDTSDLTGIAHGSLGSVAYVLDNAGQVLHSTMDVPLDPAELVISESDAFTVDAACQINSTGFSYDGRGRLTTDPDRTYTWDAANRLTGAGDLVSEYNGINDIISQTEGASTITYYYHHAVQRHPILAERDGTDGDWLRFYVCAPDGRLLYMIDHATADAVSFYHFDRMGNTLFLTNESGDVTDAYAYTPFGTLLGHTGTSNQPFTFIGEWGGRQVDDSGEFYQMRARYFHTRTARFISRDPVSPVLKKPLSLNPYLYSLDNPLKYIDEIGLCPSEEINEPKDELSQSLRGQAEQSTSAIADLANVYPHYMEQNLGAAGGWMKDNAAGLVAATDPGQWLALGVNVALNSMVANAQQNNGQQNPAGNQYNNALTNKIGESNRDKDQLYDVAPLAATLLNIPYVGEGINAMQVMEVSAKTLAALGDNYKNAREAGKFLAEVDGTRKAVNIRENATRTVKQLKKNPVWRFLKWLRDL